MENYNKEFRSQKSEYRIPSQLPKKLLNHKDHKEHKVFISFFSTQPLNDLTTQLRFEESEKKTANHPNNMKIFTAETQRTQSQTTPYMICRKNFPTP